MLALALGGRTVAEWQRAMTPGEFEAWAAFHELWPFDDLHRHHRPAALVAGSMAGRVADHLSWLQPPGGFGAAGAVGDGVPLDDDAAGVAGDGDEAGGLEAAGAWGGATGGVAHDGVAAAGDATADGRPAGVMAGTAGAASAARGAWARAPGGAAESADAAATARAAGTPASPPQPRAPRRTAADISTLRAFGLWQNGKVVKR